MLDQTIGNTIGNTTDNTIGNTTNTTGSSTGLQHDHTSEDAATLWMSQGNCRNYPPAAFFPSDGVGVDRARKICATCPVIETCLEYALHNRIEHGVWGGCSERERRRILKRRRGLAVTAAS